MMGERLTPQTPPRASSQYIAVKAPVLPFDRFPGVDSLLGPQMRATGEVMGIDSRFEQAYAKSQLGAGIRLPASGTVFISVKNRDKEAAVELARQLSDLGFRLMATSGTQRHLATKGTVRLALGLTSRM